MTCKTCFCIQLHELVQHAWFPIFSQRLANTFWGSLCLPHSSIWQGSKQENLGKVLVVLKSTIAACCNLIHYDIENIHLIVLVSMHASLYYQCHPFHRNRISFFEFFLSLWIVDFLLLQHRYQSKPVWSGLSLRTACDNIQDSWKISADNFKFSNSRLKHFQCLKKI
jgi:hypothetical protein